MLVSALLVLADVLILLAAASLVLVNVLLVLAGASLLLVNVLQFTQISRVHLPFTYKTIRNSDGDPQLIRCVPNTTEIRELRFKKPSPDSPTKHRTPTSRLCPEYCK
jgi:uncharacterized protein (DUF58 family)